MEEKAFAVIATQGRDQHISRIQLYRVADASAGSVEPTFNKEWYQVVSCAPMGGTDTIG